MPLPPLFVQRAHRQVALGMNVERHLIVCDPFVRKLPDQMSGDRSPKLPVVFPGQRFNIVEEFTAGNAGVIVEELLTVRERRLYVLAHLEFQWIGAENEGPSKVCLPLLEDRAKVEEKDVVFTNGVVRRIVGVRKERILPGTNDSLVPVGRDSV